MRRLLRWQMGIGAASDWLRHAAQEAGDDLPSVLKQAPVLAPGGALALEVFGLLYGDGDDWSVADAVTVMRGLGLSGEGLLRCLHQVLALRSEWRAQMAAMARHGGAG